MIGVIVGYEVYERASYRYKLRIIHNLPYEDRVALAEYANKSKVTASAGGSSILGNNVDSEIWVDHVWTQCIGVYEDGEYALNQEKCGCGANRA